MSNQTLNRSRIIFNDLKKKERKKKVDSALEMGTRSLTVSSQMPKTSIRLFECYCCRFPPFVPFRRSLSLCAPSPRVPPSRCCSIFKRTCSVRVILADAGEGRDESLMVEKGKKRSAVQSVHSGNTSAHAGRRRVWWKEEMEGCWRRP